MYIELPHGIKMTDYEGKAHIFVKYQWVRVRRH